jgi:hypothetical protein
VPGIVPSRGRMPLTDSSATSFPGQRDTADRSYRSSVYTSTGGSYKGNEMACIGRGATRDQVENKMNSE